MITADATPLHAREGTVALLPHFMPHAEGLQTLGGRVMPLREEDRALAASCAQERTLAQLGALSHGVGPSLDRLLAAGYLVRLPPPSPDEPAGPRDVVLSPHIDDAALSLGGWMAVRRGHAAPPLVINVFSVQSYQSGLRVPAARLDAVALAEDRLAARILGYECHWLGLKGAQDRCDLALAGVMGWSAPDVAAQERFQRDIDEVTRHVVAVVERAVGREPVARLFAPAAIGGHLDHVIAALAAPLIARRLNLLPHCVILYEDLPYAAAGMSGGVDLETRVPQLETFAGAVADKRAALSVFKTRLREPQIALCIAHAHRLAQEKDGAAERFFVRHP